MTVSPFLPALLSLWQPLRGTAEIILGFSLALLISTWAGYPAVIGLLARWRRLRRRRPAALPTVSLIIAAHNEADEIEARLRNALALDYPADHLEIIVSEDGSVDGTAEHVRAFPEVRLLSHGRRLGKAEAINRAVAEASGEILVFSDANNAYPAAALRALTAPFADARVGAVTGRKEVSGKYGVGGGESVYWKFEGWLIQQESACGGTVAGFGEVLALRRSCFHPLPRQVMINDDLYLLLQVLAQGRRVMAAPGAVSEELPSARMADEWERRQRMSVGRCAALWMLKGALRRAQPSNLVKLLFHQVLRQFSGVWMLLAAVAGLPLLVLPGVPAGVRALAWGQAAFYALAALGGLARTVGLRLGRLEAPCFFCVAQAASLKGWWRYLRGRSNPLWNRARRVSRASAPAPQSPSVTGGVIVNGVAWAYSSFLLGKVLVFGSIVVLARLLAPRSFGEVALALTTLTVLEIFGALGLTSALIYEQSDVDDAASVCFWVTIGTSVLEVGAVWFLAPHLATFFHEPELVPMLRLLMISLVITVAGETHDTLLRRNLAFDRKIIPDLGMAGVKGAVSILLALLGFGAWSLIWGQVVGSLACTLLLWKITAWHPRLHWKPEVARRMFQYAKHIYLLDASGIILSNLDTITIGRMLGDSLLGFYTLAWRIPEVVLISGLNVVTRVVFPAFSRLQDETQRVRVAVLQTVRYTSLFTMPVSVALYLLAPQIIMAFYGWRWMPSAPVLRILALYGGLRCVSHHFGDAYKGTGHPEILSRLTLVWWVLLPPSLIAGAHYGGLLGIAWGEVTARGIMTAIYLVLGIKILELSPRDLWRSFAPATESAVALGVALVILQALLPAMAARLQLVILTMAGSLVFAVFLLIRHRPVVNDALLSLKEMPRRAPAEAGEPTAVAAGPK